MRKTKEMKRRERLEKLVKLVDRQKITLINEERLLDLCVEMSNMLIDQDEKIERLKEQIRYCQSDVNDMRQCY